jgi:acyl dehydratase
MTLYFEDLTVGRAFAFPPRTVTREEIVAFAGEYDPQPFHLDEEAAKDSFFGGLVASGWHTGCLAMRVIADGLLNGAAGLGSPGIDELNWLKPVRAGDAITVSARIDEAKESRSRPDVGLAKFIVSVANQHGETVMTWENWIMFARRPKAA